MTAMNTPTIPEPPRAAPLLLWRAAGAFLQTLFNLFGAPEAIAAQDVLSARTRTFLLAWLRAGEALLRRLLLIEAAALAPPASSLHADKRRTPRQRRLREFFADKPEDWRVAFRVLGPPASRRRASAMAGDTLAVHTRLHSAWPLAERAEALLRAYNTPAPFAQRLARRLRAGAARIAQLLALPRQRKRKSGDPPHLADILGPELLAACEAEVPNRCFDSS
jgi:hypothetical protein